jgi:hypothetical protein
LPGFKGASVWITLSISRPDGLRRLRPSALTMPAVTVAWNPSGFADRDDQLADAQPCRAAELGIGQAARGEAQDRQIGRRIAADRRGFDLLAIRHRGGEPARAGNDMVVGQEITVRGEHDPRTDAARAAILGEAGDMRDGGSDPLDRVGDARRIGIERVVFKQAVKWHEKNVISRDPAPTRSNGEWCPGHPADGAGAAQRRSFSPSSRMKEPTCLIKHPMP